MEKRKQYRHLNAFVLMALAESPSHGAAVHDTLLRRLPVFKADTGAVYRALQKLEREGEIESAWDTQASGAPRKVYSLTPLGWERLAFWKQDIETRMRILEVFLETYGRLRPPSAGQPGDVS